MMTAAYGAFPCCSEAKMTSDNGRKEIRERVMISHLKISSYVQV